MHDICAHGHMARKCPHCEVEKAEYYVIRLEEEIVSMVKEIKLLRRQCEKQEA